MKLYLAAVYSNNFNVNGALYNRLTDGEKWQRDSAEHLLESYHYVNRQRYVDILRADKKKVFLDSGAFSAFTKGVDIDIPGYCAYIKRNTDIIENVDGVLMASVLDGIGDPLKTYQNQLEMERLGVRALPCFHYGEDERYLEYYIANYAYITLGGMVPISKPQLKLWLDRIWEKYLTDGAGRPRTRVHGFGLTTISLMKRYPWYSVDSSSWIQIANNGGVLVMPENKVVSVSDQSPQRRVENQHITTMTPVVRQTLEQRLAQCGADVERLKSNYLARWSYNIWAFGQLGKNGFEKEAVLDLEQEGLF